MERKWSPGPWSMHDGGDSPGVESQVESVIVCGDYRKWDCGGVYGRDRDEIYANANLIAAAPELFEALAQIIARHGSHLISHDRPAFNAAQRALKKAEEGEDV